MTNAIDIEPLRALAKRASVRIEDDAVAKRFEKLAVARLLKDGRNFRPALEADIRFAPQWAKDAYARSEQVSVVRINKAASARVRTVARRVADTCKVAAGDEATRPDHVAEIQSARKFLAKFGNTDFDVAARKALEFARVLDVWTAQAESLAVCPAQSLVLLGGRIWHRVTSVVELRRVGREFGNCLARTTRASTYGALMMCGRAQFWVLRTVEGKGLIVAMAPAPHATQFTEVKGPGNAPVRADNPDLIQLGIFLGVRPPAPEPPPPPPRPVWSELAAALLADRSRCRCPLCDPALRPFRLRRTFGAS